MSGTIDLDEARAMFSRPEPGAPKQTTTKPKQRRDSAAADAAALKKAGKDWEGHDKMAVMMAQKRRQKYAVLGNGDDAILLFGKHKDSKVSLLASTMDGRDYLRWMNGQEFAPELMKVVRSWLART